MQKRLKDTTVTEKVATICQSISVSGSAQSTGNDHDCVVHRGGVIKATSASLQQSIQIVESGEITNSAQDDASPRSVDDAMHTSEQDGQQDAEQFY